MSPLILSPLQQSLNNYKEQLYEDDNIKLRPLHWNKIKADEKTVWKKLDTDYLELDSSIVDLVKDCFA